MVADTVKPNPVYSFSLTDTATSLNSIGNGAVIQSSNCKNFELWVSMTSASTYPTIALQVSSDGNNWLTAANVTPTGNMTQLSINNTMPDFVRVSVTHAGTNVVGGALNWRMW